MRTQKKVLLLNDTTNWYHFGCTATSTAIKEQLLRLGHILEPVPIVKLQQLQFVPTTAGEFAQKHTFEAFKLANQKLIQLIQDCDVVLVNGEGTIHGVKPAPIALLYLAYISKTFLKKPVGIINHSVYPQDGLSLDDQSVANLYKFVYQTIDFAAIREPISYDLMRTLGVSAVESFDCMPIYIKNHPLSSKPRQSNILLIAGSAAWLNLGINAAEYDNIKKLEPSLDSFAQYIAAMRGKGFQIHFLYGALENPAKDDQSFIQYLKSKNVDFIVKEAKNLDEWLTIIAQSTLLVSGRLHHSIAATCLGTPCIVLNSNTPKVDGLLKVLEDEAVVQYTDPDLVMKLLAKTEVKLQESATVTGASPWLEKLCEKAMKNFSWSALQTNL